MVRLRCALVTLLLPWSLGCGEEAASSSEDPPPQDPPPCLAGQVTVADGRCFDAGVAACGVGFVADGMGGCIADLPAMCPPGTMAIPGEVACREVAPCGDGPWGDIPLEPDAQHVDATYRGTGSGTIDQPWTTIQQAVDAAPPGGMVAVAAGSYGDVIIQNKAVRIWGRCPQMVDIRDTNDDFGVVIVGSDGAELHTLAVSFGGGALVGVSGSLDVVLDRLWLHDAPPQFAALSLTHLAGPATITLRSSLLEGLSALGAFADGVGLVVEDSVIRDGVSPFADGSGAGIRVNPDADLTPGTLTVRRSVIEQTAGLGVFSLGSIAEVEDSVVRDVRITGAGPGLGRGISVQHAGSAGQPGVLSVSRSVVAGNADMGVFVYGSDASIDNSVVRGTLLSQSGLDGRGVNVTVDPTTERQSQLTLSRSVVEANHFANVVVSGSLGTIEHSIVRDPIPAGPVGIARGIQIQASANNAARSEATVVSTMVEGAGDMGIFVGDADATIVGVIVTGTLALPDGTLGDGLTVFANDQPAAVSLTDALIINSVRAGIASFGATIEVAGSTLTCNGIDINIETLSAFEPSLFDGGGNSCGCTEEVDCKATSSSLEPPML